jgi:predicted RNA binding protein YcfA (HicA-like mRNA interferase family)
VSSREVIARLQAEGWQLARVKGSHHHFRHATRTGTVTVPHPRKDLPFGTLRGIEKSCGVTLLG